MKQYTPSEEASIEAFTRELGIFLRRNFGDEIQPNNHSHDKYLPKLAHPAKSDEPMMETTSMLSKQGYLKVTGKES